jgi:DNA-binding transcriptional ArsR family regulator
MLRRKSGLTTVVQFYGCLDQRSFNAGGIGHIFGYVMLVRVIRQLTLDEVQVRIRGFEKEFGMSFDDFEELFWKKRLDRRFMDEYSAWAGLVHAYRAYVEGGELDYAVEEMRELKPKETSLLTPKRLELLYSLASLRPESINDLAQKVRRDVKNVYVDLTALRALGFVSFNKRGKRNIVPETLVEEITLLIR